MITLKSRLTDEESNVLRESRNLLLEDREIGDITVSDIYYLSCETNISYHKIFSEFMYVYHQDEYRKKNTYV